MRPALGLVMNQMRIMKRGGHMIDLELTKDLILIIEDHMKMKKGGH